MRIVIVDLHCNSLIINTLRQLLKNDVGFKKHFYILQEAIEEGYEVLDYVSGTTSELFGPLKKSGFLKRLEASYVLKKNGYKHDAISVISEPSEIRDDDLVIFYSMFNDKIVLSDLPGRKYCNVNHFFEAKSWGGIPFIKFLDPLGFEGYIGECDVLKSEFFKLYFPTENKKMIIMPYVASKRFEQSEPFSSRKNKAVALGSLTEKLAVREGIIGYYGTNNLHPMRRELFERKSENTQQIDCMIEEMEKPGVLINLREDDNFLLHYMKCFVNLVVDIISGSSSLRGKNSSYYNRDMVKLLNEYKMFIYPEDVTGVPALGFVEGMNCGCAYIGVECSAYGDLGMKSGIDYIGYDGSYDDLISKIRYYQIHDHECEKIAGNGYRFVKENLNSKNVFRNLIKQFKENGNCSEPLANP